MAKYSLWVRDGFDNSFCVPLSRDGQTYKEKVELYEIDLVTVSLGKEKFIEQLKKSNLAPNNFNWNSVRGYVQYQRNQEKCYLPLLFEPDTLLIKMLNFENKYRYHESYSETKIIERFKKGYLSGAFSTVASYLSHYRDFLLEQIQQNPNLLTSCYLKKRIAQRMYTCIYSIDEKERQEYKNDILLCMLEYSTFRRLKTMEYDCSIGDSIVNIIDEVSIKVPSDDLSERWDPDEEAFLSEEEKKLMYG